MSHPSFLQLDRLALGVEPDTETGAHIASCHSCQQHLELVACELPTPGWVLQLEEPRRLRWRWGLALAAVAALALVVVNVIPPQERVTAKGLPSVALYVKRGEKVMVWDGASPVQIGDRLMLKVIPEGHSRVTVYSGEVKLYEGELGGDEVLLPAAWRVDAAPGVETIRVLLEGDELESWSVRLELPKSWGE